MIDLNPRKAATALFFLGLAAYALFQGRYLLLGPQVKVLSPKDNELLGDSVVVVSGTSKNATFLSLDDRQIYTDKGGGWQEKLLASSGLNIIKIVARDRFGRQTEKLIRVVLN